MQQRDYLTSAKTRNDSNLQEPFLISSTLAVFVQQHTQCQLSVCLLGGGGVFMLAGYVDYTYLENHSVASLGFSSANLKPQWHYCSAC